MTFRSATPGLAGSTIALCVLTLLAGCASRSLNAPQVVDWSDGARPAGPAATVVPARAQTYTVKREDTLFSIAKAFNVSPTDLAAWNNLGPNPRLQTNQVLRVNAPTTTSDSPTAVTQPIGSETIEQRPLGSAGGPAAGSSNAPLKTGPIGVKRPYSDATLAELSKSDGDGSAAAAPAPALEAAPPATATATAAPATPAVNWAWPAPGKVSNTFADPKSKGIDIPGKAGDAVLAAADGKVTFAGAGVLGYGNFIIVRHTPELLSVYANNRANLVKEGAAVTKGQKIAEMGAAGSDPAKLHFEIRNDSKPVDPLKYLPAR